MKLAILMTVYAYPELANTFIQQVLQSEDVSVFVHIDKKHDEIKNEILRIPRVYLIPDNIKVEWGNFTHVKSILHLMEYAKSVDEFDYYSIHSGQDLLINPVDKLLNRLEQEKKIAYLDCQELPITAWGPDGGWYRITYRWPGFLVRRMVNGSLLSMMRRVFLELNQRNILRKNHLNPEIKWYGGSDWFTVSAQGVNEILKVYKEDKSFVDIFEHSFIGSELFFNTILCNLGRDEDIVTDDNLRYIDWKNKEDGQAKGSPKIMRLSDYESILNSGKMFARKFSVTETELIHKIVQNSQGT